MVVQTRDSSLNSKSFDVRCNVVGFCDPDDELMTLLGSDVLEVVLVDSGKHRACKHSIIGKD